MCSENGRTSIFEDDESVENDVVKEQSTRARRRQGRPPGRGRYYQPLPEGRKYFFLAADILMLKSALQQNPYMNGSGAWQVVASEVTEAYPKMKPKVRQVKDRCQFLIKKLLKKEMEDINRIGTEDEFAERERLIQDVYNLRSASWNSDIESVQGTRKSQRAETACERDAAEAYLQYDAEEVTAEDLVDEAFEVVSPFVPVRELSQSLRNGRAAAASPSCSASSPHSATNYVDPKPETVRECRCRKRGVSPVGDWISQKAALELRIRKEEHELKMQQLRADMEHKAAQRRVDSDFRNEQLRLESRRLDIEEARVEEMRMQRLIFEKLMQK